MRSEYTHHAPHSGTQRHSNARFIIGLAAAAIIAVAAIILVAQIRDAVDPIRRLEAERQAYRAEMIDTSLSELDIAVAGAWRVFPLLLVASASFVALAAAYKRFVPQTNIEHAFDVSRLRAIHQAGQTPQSLTYSPHLSNRSEQSLLPEPMLDAPTLALPAITDLATLNHVPTPQSVLLGLAENGERITVPVSALWHIATAGPTGNGKSNIHRLLLGQLLAMNAKVAIGDPKWTPYDREQDEDWRPIERRLHIKPAATADEIGGLLDWSNDELTRRLERRRNGEKIGGPLFICLDELPWIADNVKGGADQIGELARLGRGVGLFVMAAAQDFLVKTVSLSGARDQFRSTYYLGGDLKTGSVLLDIPQRDLSSYEQQLGVGLAMLRSAATKPPRVVRVPLVSNQALYQLLGETPDTPGAAVATNGGINEDRTFGFRIPTRPMPVSQELVIDQSRVSHTEPLDYSAAQSQIASAEEQRIVDLFLEGKDAGAIVTELYKMTSKAGKPYMAKLAEVQEVIRKAMRRLGK